MKSVWLRTKGTFTEEPDFKLIHYPKDWTLEQFHDAIARDDPAVTILGTYLRVPQIDDISGKIVYLVSDTSEHD
jgi:hypothetical protein